MGTISYLKDRFRKSSADARQATVTVSAYGFGIGTTFVPWQSVSEIRAWKADLGTFDEAFLEFFFAGQCLAIGEDQTGFAGLEAAMIGVFPDTAGWRQAVIKPAFARNETVLFRRTEP